MGPGSKVDFLTLDDVVTITRISPCHILLLCVLHGSLTRKLPLFYNCQGKFLLKIQIQEPIFKFKNRIK